MLSKKWKKFLLLSMSAVMLCGCQPSASGDTTKEDNTETKEQETGLNTETKVEPLYEFTDEAFLSMKDFIEYIPRAGLSGVKENGDYFHLPNVEEYTVMQGGCTDGEYMYLILENNTLDLDMLFKVDMNTWEIVAQSEGLPLDHANGMGYNSKLDTLIVSHNTGAVNDISFVC